MVTRPAAILAMLIALATGAVAARAQTAPTTATAPTAAAAAGPAAAPAAVVVVEGVIDNFTQRRIERRFADARAAGATTVILSLNTPGGLVEAALNLTRFLRGQDDLHVIAYIDQRAYSAGTMIALACDEIVMGRDAVIGDSAPIAMSPDGGVQTLGETERGKIESPILEDFRISAERNGYDPYLVGAMVTLGRVVHWVQSPDGDQRRFVNPETYKTLTAGGWQPVPYVEDPVDGANTLLTVGTDRAVKLGLAAGTAASVAQLAADRGLAVVATYVPTRGERFLQWVGSPQVRGVVLVGLMISLYVAMHTPGQGIPEAAALTCLGLLVGIPLLTGHAQWYEVVAIVLGLGLIAVELFVIPGFGLAGITGLILLLGGLLMTFVPREPWRFPLSVPTLAGTRDAMTTGLYVITAGLAVSMLLALWLRRFLPKLPYFNKLILTDVAGQGGGGSTTVVGDPTPWPGVGAAGVAVTDLRPAGSVKFTDESAGVERLVSVVADTGYVARGATVVVLEVAGNRVVVRKVED